MECTKKQAHYAPLYPQLIKLLVTHLPHLCLVTDWMEQEEKENSSMLIYSILSTVTPFISTGFQSPSLALKIPKSRLTPELVKKGTLSSSLYFYMTKFSLRTVVLATIQSSPLRALIVLQQLANLPLDELTAYHEHITNVIPSLLDNTIPRRILNLYLQIWKELSVTESRR